MSSEPKDRASKRKARFEENWRWYLTGEDTGGARTEYEQLVKWFLQVAGLVPGDPRCLECNRPLSPPGSWLSGARPSSYSPLLCSSCERAMREEEAGAEVELSMLFADVRGSTPLAEQTSISEFRTLIQRFFKVGGDVLVRHNAMVNRLMGDQIIGLFVPRFAGKRHAQVAVEAALDLLGAMGYGSREGPWLPVGIGVHTGTAYVGAVGSKEGVNEIAVLGSAPTLAARLSSQAAGGEILVSETSATLAGIDTELRQLELKGISEPVTVRVLRVETDKV